jgi:pimeloyl-ACP methyl ester carboxylesterase
LYKKYLQRLALFCGALLLSAGCSHTITQVHSSNNKSVQPLVFTFSDGNSAQYFYLKKTLSSTLKSPADPVTYMFVVGGSDCTSFSHFLPQYFRGLEGESGDLHIFMLQKRFINARTWGRSFGCSQQFVRADYPEQWIADQLEFIQQQLSVLGKHPNRRIVLLGISEGGEIAPIIAQRIPQTTHLVILANGGLDPLAAYSLQRSKQGLMPSEKLLKLLEEPVLGKSKSTDRILGRTAAYWLQVNNIQQIETLLLLNMPILMTMGEEDQVVPIESAWYAKDEFEKQSNKSLTLVTYPGADHSLASQKINFLPDFFHKMDLWLSEKDSAIFEGAP